MNRVLACLAIIWVCNTNLMAQQGQIDLIATTNVHEAALAGDWQKDAKSLSVSNSRAKIVLPYRTSKSYSLTLEFTRTEGNDSIGIALPVGGGQCVLNLSAWDGKAHGIGIIDGKLARDNATTITPGALLNDHPYRLLVEVDVSKNDASIESQLDGKSLLSWRGQPSSLTMHKSWTMPQSDCVGLLTNCAVTFHHLSVSELSTGMRMTQSPTVKRGQPALQNDGSAKGAPILYDLSHGQRALSGLDRVAKSCGVSIATTESLTDQTLKGKRLLVLRGVKKEFSDSEIDVVQTFVRGGGALFLAIDEERRTSLGETRVNELVRPFGFRFTDDLPYLHNCGGMAKKGTINASDREVAFSGGRAVEGGQPFAFQLDEDGRTGPVFAASDQVNGGGRIVVMGEMMAPLLMGTRDGTRLSGVPRDPTKTTYWGKDSTKFMEEVFAWLIDRPRRIESAPIESADRSSVAIGSQN